MEIVAENAYATAWTPHGSESYDVVPRNEEGRKRIAVVAEHHGWTEQIDEENGSIFVYTDQDVFAFMQQVAGGFDIVVTPTESGGIEVYAAPPGIVPLHAEGENLRDALEGILDTLETIQYPGSD